MSLPLYATSPLPWAVLVLLLAVVCWRKWPRGLRYPAVAIEVVLVLLMTPLGAAVLASGVEARLPPAAGCAVPAPDTLVLLTGGFRRPPEGPEDFAALRALNVRRLFAAVTLWRRTPGTQLVVSGGGGYSVAEATVVANLASQMGIPATAIRVETRSRNTWENARDTAELAPAIPRRIWLVTSALHMPRALGAFRAWGFTPCAWPSEREDSRIKLTPGAFVPQPTAAFTSTLALHELLGGVQYAWLEWRHRSAATVPHTP